MSFSTLIFLVGCIGSYKLGALNQRHPGEAWASCRNAVLWLWSWMNK